MNQQEYNRTCRNLERWGAFIEKAAANPKKFPDAEPNLEMRRAQCTIWAYQVAEAEKQGITDAPGAAGDMAVNSALETSENATK